MTYITRAIVLIVLFLMFTSQAGAHPGRTASDGCHYCRTNCASWGEVAGARHCHGAPAYTPPPEPVYVPPPEPEPVFIPEPEPEPDPVIAPVVESGEPPDSDEVITEPITTESQPSEQEGQVLGVQDEASANYDWLWGVLAGGGAAFWIASKRKKKEEA